MLNLSVYQHTKRSLTDCHSTAHVSLPANIDIPSVAICLCTKSSHDLSDKRSTIPHLIVAESNAHVRMMSYLYLIGSTLTQDGDREGCHDIPAPERFSHRGGHLHSLDGGDGRQFYHRRLRHLRGR